MTAVGARRAVVTLGLTLSFFIRGSADTPRVAQRVEDCLLPLVRALASKDKAARVRAADELAALGAGAADATPALIAALEDEDPDVTASVWYALKEIGPPSVPYLVRTLRQKDAAKSLRVIRALNSMAARAEAATPALCEISLGGESRQLRLAATEALGGVGNDKKAASTLAGVAVKDKDRALRITALTSLDALGPKAKSALPALSSLLDEEEDDGLGAMAVSAVIEIGGKESIIYFEKRIADGGKGVNVRCRAILAAGSMKSQRARVIPVLLRVLRDNTAAVEVRACAANVLGDMGPDAAGAVPTLCKLLRDKSPRVRIRAAAAIAHIDKSNTSATSSLIRDSKDKEPSVRWEAVRELGEVESQAKVIVPVLTRSLTDDHPHVRYAAVVGLKRMCSLASPAVPKIKELLRDDNPNVRSEAALALRAIQKASARSAP
jgi:HEAT repeat protein